MRTPTVCCRPNALTFDVLRFMLLYSLPHAELDDAIGIVSTALRAGVLDEPPIRRFTLAEIAAAHQAQESGVTGKVLVDIPE